MTLEQNLTRARKKLRDVEIEEENFESEAKIALPGGFILMIAAIVLMIATGSDVFGILTVIAFLWWLKIALFNGEKDRNNRKANINAEISRLTSRRNRESQQKRKARQKEDQVKKRKQDLDNAKGLVEKGGIENLNRAIGIFEKYGK